MQHNTALVAQVQVGTVVQLLQAYTAGGHTLAAGTVGVVAGNVGTALHSCTVAGRTLVLPLRYLGLATSAQAATVQAPTTPATAPTAPVAAPVATPAPVATQPPPTPPAAPQAPPALPVATPAPQPVLVHPLHLPGGLVVPAGTPVQAHTTGGTHCTIHAWASVQGSAGTLVRVGPVPCPVAYLQWPHVPQAPAHMPGAQGATTPVPNPRQGLTLQARRVLTVLAGASGPLSRKQLAACTGQAKGWAALLGAPTRGPVQAHTLQGRGLVHCTFSGNVLLYTITTAGLAALVAAGGPV